MSGEELRAAGYPSGEFDARKWAEEFVRIFPDARPDRDTMLGWFANAIMTGYDHAKREERAALAAPSTPEPSGLTPAERHAIDAILDRPNADPDDDAAIAARAAVRAAPSTEPALDERLRAFVEHRVGLAALQHPEDWRERDLYLAGAADAVSEAIARLAESQP